ncbi:nucleolar protein 6 [Battus philenor]|uniref:nucleolar protein 6 n=1 Tax=Battus philenor TaxID=42288 RepID=UPI0035D134C3
MVKREKINSISDNDDESSVINENGKRPAEAQGKDDKKRLRTKNLYRQPTVRELNRLQETENLFNSNLFRLQIEEVLEEVKIKEKSIKRFDEWFKKFKDHLLSIPEDDVEYDLTEKTIFKNLKVKSPIGSELNKTKCMFRFHKFQNIDIVGSYALGNSINSKLIVDVQITTPPDTYTKNDSINYKYHKKRATYLAVIASHLKTLEIIQEIKYTYLKGCNTKPLIDVKPSGKLGETLIVRINLVCDAESFKLHRFSPQRNNLREAWLFEDEIDNTSDIGPPTPYYNNSILSDLTSSINQELLNETFLNRENLKQAVVLLKIWLRQRRLHVSGYVISMFVAHLVQIKRINNIMSSYQIIRNVWIALQSSEWDTKGTTLYKGPGPVPSLDEYLQYFPVVFIDKSGYYNICWDMHKGTYNTLKRECSLAIEMLDNPKINSFIPLFMTPMHDLTKFDHIIRFKNLNELVDSVLKKVPRESRVNYGVHKLPLVTETIYSMLSRGLGDRVELIQQLLESDLSWSIDKSVDTERSRCSEKLSFGLVLNSENVINIVDRGPPANLPTSEEFREFWGEKSELRRFQDGSITEACVWDADTMAERRALPKQIINYLMNFKYGVPSSQMFHVTDQLDSVLMCKMAAEYAEERSIDVLRAFDDLRRDLRALSQLPLDISAVYGISSVFSYCCPQAPGASPPQPYARRRWSSALLKDAPGSQVPVYTPASTAVLELGHSGKWPGDLEAFRCLKAAFHIQIADRLTKQYSLPTQPYPTHLDVLKHGYVFRLKIAHSKEITLLRREMENGVVKHKESEESLSLQCETMLLPRLRGAMHGLHQKHPAFGPGACLLKRWLSAHLLSPPHFPAVLVELLMAVVFVRPAPLEPPSQPLSAFLRALRTLVDTDWSREVIVLDFNGDMTREEIAELERKLCGSEAENMPPMRVVSSCDGELPGAWSRAAPAREALLRAQSIARATLAYLQKALLEDFKDNILGIFVPSLSGYDAIIHLTPGLVPYTSEKVDQTPRERRKTDAVLDDMVPVVEFNPVSKYLDELRSAYDEFALFFHDFYGGVEVAVLWRPTIDDLREFQVTNAKALMPVEVEGETKYRVNKEALLEDFRILGRGLVLDITVP